MKIKIVTNKGSWSCANTGKGFFIQRLISSLIEKGVTVTCKPDDVADVELGIGKFILPKKRVRRRVVRMGPSHFDTNQNWKQLNKRKAQAVKEADGVIYQSEWAQNVGHRYLGMNSTEAVIFNGDEIYKNTNKKAMMDTAIMSTRKWVPQKRLKQTLKIFKEKVESKERKLVVLGECDKKLKRKFGSPNVIFCGPQAQGIVQSMLNHAAFLLHPVWLDACPNSVIEAVAHGCPVLCSSQGGTKEIVETTKSGGIVYEEEWDGRPVDLNKPLKMDEDFWTNAIIQMYHAPVKINPDPINIDNIADQYIEFFDKVLK